MDKKKKKRKIMINYWKSMNELRNFDSWIYKLMNNQTNPDIFYYSYNYTDQLTTYDLFTHYFIDSIIHAFVGSLIHTLMNLALVSIER